MLANNGEEVIKCFKSNLNEIDLVIMDIIMPEKNGIEAFKALKKIEPDVKVILCSGYSSGHNMQELSDLGVSNFLKKPFNINELSNIKDIVISTMDTELHKLLKSRITKVKTTYKFSNWEPEAGPGISIEK